MSFEKSIVFAIIFASIVVLANYSVQFQIGSTLLTYGALVYPFSFLFLDILSEKHHKKEVLKTLRYGILFAFLPSYFVSQPSIAIASICAFFVSQHLDVYIFYFLKKILPKLWWLRNNASTMIAQLIDGMIFFHIAFWGQWSWREILIAAFLDCCVKFVVIVCNTPLFYIFAIRIKSKILL